MKFILLINVKMATIVGSLTFISIINITSEFICPYFSFYEQFKLFSVEYEKSFIPSGPGPIHRLFLFKKSDLELFFSLDLFSTVMLFSG